MIESIRMRYLALLCVFLLVNAAEWKELDDVFDFSYTYGTSSDNFGFFHYVYCGSAERNNVLYLRRKVSSNEIYKTGFAIRGECRGAQISVMGQRVYIAYQVVEPCSFGSYACSAIYFKESYDLGETWSEVVIVEPYPFNVTYNYDPLLLQDPYTGGVWLTYKSLHKENPTEIKVVNKYPKVTKFTDPIIVSITNQSTIIPGGFSFARTENRTGSKIHIAWQVKAEESSYQNKIFTSYSDKKAKEWHKPLAIAETNLGDHHSPLVFASDGSHLYLLVSRTDQTQRGVWMIYSDNQGNNWEKPVRISSPKNYLAVAAQVCTIKGKKRLYVLGQDQILEKASETLWYLDTNTKKVVSLGNPYGNEINDCFNPHIICNDNTVELVCKARVSKQKYKLIYNRLKTHEA